jgi:preprotein translocase subunit SecE
VPQRKAAQTGGGNSGGGSGNNKAARSQRAVTAPPKSGLVARWEGLQKTFRETVAELRKVQWPDRTTTRNLTLVVIGMSTALAVVLGLLDALLTWVIEWLLKLPIGG